MRVWLHVVAGVTNPWITARRIAKWISCELLKSAGPTDLRRTGEYVGFAEGKAALGMVVRQQTSFH
jgi:hypothetical protein